MLDHRTSPPVTECVPRPRAEGNSISLRSDEQHRALLGESLARMLCLGRTGCTTRPDTVRTAYLLRHSSRVRFLYSRAVQLPRRREFLDPAPCSASTRATACISAANPSWHAPTR